MHNASWTTIMVHSRDDQEVGVAHKVKSPENQPHFSQTTMGQYWLGETKPKQAFRSTRNAFKKFLWNFNFFYSTDFITDWLTACLMPSDKRNSITANATGLIFFTVRRRFIPRGAFWHTTVRAMHSSGTYQYPPLSSLLRVKSVNLVVARDGFLCIMRNLVSCCQTHSLHGAYRLIIIST